MGLFFTILTYATLAIVAVLGVGLIGYALAVIRTERRYNHLPGPKRISFFFGNLRNITEPKRKAGVPISLIVYNMAREYGSLFWVRVLWRPHVFALAPEIVKELLLNSRHTKPQSFYRIFQSLFGARLMGHGLVSEINHEKWFHRRAIMNPAFRRKYLMSMMEQFNEGSETLCQHLSKKSDGKTEIKMLDEFDNVTLDVIAKIAFSMNTDAIINPNCPFPLAVSTVLKGMQMMLDSPWATIDPRREHREMRQKVREAVSFVRQTGLQQITERIEARRRGDHVPSDVLNLILDGANDLMGDEDFQMENMVDEFVTLFMAGQETTSNLLAFTLQQLGRHPDVAKKLQAEVDEVLGQKHVVGYEDLAKLEYMMRVFKETLRLYPPVVGTNRVSAHPIQYQQFTIPPNSHITVLSMVMSRMDDYFDDPLLFNPDRFKPSDDGTLPRHLYAYFPFSMGQRNCIGQQFALIEARVILGKLLQRFEFHYIQGQRQIILDELTIKPMDRCRNYATLRA